MPWAYVVFSTSFYSNNAFIPVNCRMSLPALGWCQDGVPGLQALGQSRSPALLHPMQEVGSLQAVTVLWMEVLCCSALATCTQSGTCRERGWWNGGLGLHLTKKYMYSPGSSEENVLSVTFCKPLLWIRTALHNPVWANSTRELSPSPAPALQPCLPQSPPQPACFWLLCRTQSWCCCTQKLSPTSTSHPTINIVQALSSDLKDVVHTGAAIAETTVASCMAWVPLVWSCTALQAKWMLCSSFHSTAAALHNTGLTNPKANQGQHSGQETFPTTTMCSGTSFSPAAAVLGNAVRQKTEPRIGMCVTKTTSEGRAEVRGKRCDTPPRAAAEMG